MANGQHKVEISWFKLIQILLHWDSFWANSEETENWIELGFFGVYFLSYVHFKCVSNLSLFGGNILAPRFGRSRQNRKRRYIPSSIATNRSHNVVLFWSSITPMQDWRQSNDTLILGSTALWRAFILLHVDHVLTSSVIFESLRSLGKEDVDDSENISENLTSCFWSHSWIIPSRFCLQNVP